MQVKKIRVLHLIEHLDVGGAERVAVDIITALDPAQFDSICCVYRHTGAFAEQLKHLHYRVVLLKKAPVSEKLIAWLGGDSWPVRLFSLPFRIVESLLFVMRLAAFIRREQIDIVHSHLYSANFWGRLSVLLLAGRVKIITTEHNTGALQSSWKVAFANRTLAPCSSRIVAVSQTVANTLLAAHWARSEQLVIIPNGIVPAEENTDKTAPENHEVLPGNAPYIAIIAYLWPVKRHDLLFRAVRICLDQGRKLTCLVIGDGPERPRLEQLVHDEELSNTVIFLGERYDIPALLAQIDIVVSCSDSEGLPVNLLEALAANVAVVATDVGGTGEIIRHQQTGLLVPANNAQALAEAIGRLLDDPELAQRLAAKGRTLVQEHYAMARVIEQWQALYQQVLLNNS